MPLYDADLEAADGIPSSVAELAANIRAAEVLVIVTPEYNGAFTPLLKNTVDWLTRVDHRILAHLVVLLASASPGAGGGARAVAMTRTWMDNIGVTVADRTLSIGGAELGANGSIVGLDNVAVADFVRWVGLASEQRSCA